MGSHACDGVMRLCAIVTLLAALAGCSGRSTSPEDVKTEPTIHDPFDNEEAELLALLMSGDLCAPRDLYEDVVTDLAAIRDTWGDSLPELRTIHYQYSYVPSDLRLDVVEDAYDDMQDGRYMAWDSLNEYYQLAGAQYNHYDFSPGFTVNLRFAPRMNSRLLLEAYAGLPGVRWIETIGLFSFSEQPNVYGYLHDFGRAYVFRNTVCPFEGCTRDENWYFRSTENGVQFVGGWNPRADTSRPTWWDEAEMVLELPREGYGYWEWANSGPPATITDLLAGNPGSNDVTLAWTAPLDSGYSGRVGGYRIMYSTSEITEENWANAHYKAGPRPNLPGAQERFVIDGLLSNTDYFIAVKSQDAAGAWSALSNIANVATTPAAGWTTFDSTNTVMNSSSVLSMVSDGRGGVWIGTYRGLMHFDGLHWQTYSALNAPKADAAIRSLSMDAIGHLWCVSIHGLHDFDGSDWELHTQSELGLAGGPYIVAVAPTGHIWVGGVRPVLADFDGTDWVLHPVPLEYTFLLCTSIAFGANGGTWATFGGGGVHRFDESGWTTYTKQNSGLGSNAVFSIAAGNDGGVWFAHDDYVWGASRFDGTAWERFSRSSSQLGYNNRFVMVDASGSVWFASSGATRYDGMTWINCQPTNSGLVSENVKCIAQDAQGNIWFGTDKGVSRLAADYVESYFGEAPESNH